MSQASRRHLIQGMTLVFALSSLIPASAAPPILEKLFRPLQRHGRAPETCTDPAVEELAANVDWLEHNIDRWGSIVAKSPDIWGEARLTKYRREVEEVLEAQRKAFKQTLAGASSTRDTALLAASLQLASGGASESGFGDNIAIDVVNDPQIESLPTRDDFGLIGDSDLFAADKLELEPTVVLDQHRRYLDHLNELRRINEGDDAADAPGYSINLVRIPVSVLPGSQTTHGYGAELTATATMQLDNDLLPNTFRDLVINDLVDQLSLPMTRFLNSDPAKVSQLLATLSVGENPKGFAVQFNQLVRLYPVILQQPTLYHAIRRRLVSQKQESFLNNISIPPSIFHFDDATTTISLREIDENDLSTLEKELAIYRVHVAPLLSAVTAIQQIWSVEVFSSMPAACPDINKLTTDQCEVLRRNLAVINGYGLVFQHQTGAIELLAQSNLKRKNHQQANRERVGEHLLHRAAFQIPNSAHNDDAFQDTDEELRNVLPEPQDAPIDFDGQQQPVAETQSLNIEVFKAEPFMALQRLESLNIRLDLPSTQLHAASIAELGGVTEQIASEIPSTVDLSRPEERLLSLTGNIGRDLRSLLSLTGLPSSLTRRSTLPFPPSELFNVYGATQLGRLAIAAHDAFKVDVLNRQVVHLTDVQSYLREEINAAFDLLMQPEFQHVWMSEISEPSLTKLIRGHQHASLDLYREQFLNQLPPEALKEPVAVLAWAVFVESVLLNDKMNHEVSSFAGNVVCNPNHPLDFFGPHPSQEARDAFASYVSAKWPLRIFTIDPVDNDQNIADTASIARQMQFAAAFAVANGEMSGRAAMNFSRNLQRDFATVALNRTAVGFVHGDNTFGWRFQPRFQTPPVQNNAVVILRDLIGGGPTDNALRRQRRLEPGMRECIAMVLTPSFVSGVTIDTRSNWYRLNKPGHSALSMQEIAEQSRSIVAMRRAAETCVRRPDLYRDGEVERMLRRVEQLDRELPLQTLQCQLPNSNTLGGFELFSSGTRELAPELLGWYGSPGYQPGVDKQTFFLVGDNFSVHETKVIVGTKEATTTLLSRQIMQVTLPKDVPIVKDERLEGVPNPQYSGYVDAHVASPYGVSGHLLIPVLKASAPKPEEKASLKAVPDGKPMQASMTLKLKDGQYVAVGNIVVSHAPVATIEIPTTITTAKAGLLGENVDIVLTPKAGDHTLSEAVIGKVKVSAGKIALGTPELIEALDPKGSLYASLAPYALWRANGSINFASADNKDLISKGVDMKLIVSIRSGDGKPNLNIGELPFRLAFHQG